MILGFIGSVSTVDGISSCGFVSKNKIMGFLAGTKQHSEHHKKNPALCFGTAFDKWQWPNRG
jgi:hypothetical protein